MKYVKILFAVALVFTLCSAFSLKKGEHKPVYALWGIGFIYRYGDILHRNSDA